MAGESRAEKRDDEEWDSSGSSRIWDATLLPNSIQGQLWKRQRDELLINREKLGFFGRGRLSLSFLLEVPNMYKQSVAFTAD